MPSPSHSALPAFCTYKGSDAILHHQTGQTALYSSAESHMTCTYSVRLTPAVALQTDAQLHLSESDKLDPRGDHLVWILAGFR